MSPDLQSVTVDGLNAEWERVQEMLPDNLALRMRRALSWLERAENEKDTDDDAAFIFYWIAFNAAYAQERSSDFKSNERDRFDRYFDDLRDLDTERIIEKAIWEIFSQSITELLDNKYVYEPFWEYQSGRGNRDWERRFESRKREVTRARGHRDTKVILRTLFDRLYTLRNQLIHGGATWKGSINRAQVGDGARIMAFLVPLFVSLMMSHPENDWGYPDYPVVR